MIAKKRLKLLFKNEMVWYAPSFHRPYLLKRDLRFDDRQVEQALKGLDGIPFLASVSYMMIPGTYAEMNSTYGEDE